MNPRTAPKMLFRPETRSTRQTSSYSAPWVEAKESPPQDITTPMIGQGTRLNDMDYKRPTSAIKTLLYLPSDDRESPRKQHSQFNQGPYLSPLRRQPPKPGGWDSRPEDSRAYSDTQYNDPYNEQLGQQFRFTTDQKKTNNLPSSIDDGPEASNIQPAMLLQPETRPISHDQLIIEVKGIYAGLVMVEAKCIDIDEKKAAAAQEKDPSKRAQLRNDQYQSLIALHKQLLHEHHDFFLASQHPAASPALSRLAAKYSMPARMWRHGIHAFLEVLHHRLPESLEHMLAFIYIAYSMMALLYETVPAFKDTWIDRLGVLGRYRMAIEDDDRKDREVWSNVARFWYNKAAENSPRVGRLYHHLAILARPYSLEQLSLYIKALTCVAPFESMISGTYTTEPGLSSLEEVDFNKAHGNLFHGNSMITGWDNSLDDGFMAKTSVKFNIEGVYTAVANIAAIFEYGSSRNGMSRGPLQRVYEDVPRRDFDGSEPLITTGTQDESSTKHQLTMTFPDVVRSALDRFSHWSMRSTSRGKASRPIRWSFVSAAYTIRSSVALTLPICTLFIVPTTARTIPRNASNEGSTESFSAAVIPLAHWPYLAFVIITLLVAQYLAHTKDPMFVWGCMMSVWAFGWWTIRADSSTSLQISAV